MNMIRPAPIQIYFNTVKALNFAGPPGAERRPAFLGAQTWPKLLLDDGVPYWVNDVGIIGHHAGIQML